VSQPPSNPKHSTDSWADVASKRREAERYALAGDMLAASLEDHEASAMAKRLRRLEQPAITPPEERQ